jgi:hypothetical protein
MPQQPLLFSRTITRRAKRTASILNNVPKASVSPTQLSAAQPTESPLSSNPVTPLSSTTPTTRKIRTSWVYRHMPDEDMQTLYYNEITAEEEWRCRYCDTTLATSGSTSGPSTHLISKHNFIKGDERDAKATRIQQSMEQAFAIAAHNPHKRRKLDGETIKQDELEVLWVRAIVAANLPFRLVESPEFRAFLIYLNDEVTDTLPKNHTDIRKWVIRQYKSMKGMLKVAIRNARSKIHISLDLWTSPNTLAILGITAQFVNQDSKLQSVVLAMKEVEGEHTGGNMAKYVMEVIKDYKIEKQLGYFIMDNADNNDTLIASLSTTLRREYNVKYDPKHHRLRCQGHIINLAVKSFLFVTDKENIDEDDETNVMEVTLQRINEWRRKGPLGKLHNFVIWLTQSTQRLHHFLECSNNHRIPRDNTTRWNSWYMMLQAAILLQSAITEFFNEFAPPDLKKDQLTDDEWSTIRRIKEFLEKLKMATKACESHQSTLDLVIPSMDYILAQFEKGKDENQDDRMGPMFNSGWAKMDKYYRLSDSTPVYVAAVVLHPQRKWRHIQKHWDPQWQEAARVQMKEFWEKSYKPSPTNPPPLCELSSRRPKNDFFKWLDDSQDEVVDEYEQYCADPIVLGVHQGLDWWMETTQQKRYPNLSKMAMDILSIPAMSADPERLFSGAKITITDRRNRLGITSIQAVECLKSWMGILESKGDDIEDENKGDQQAGLVSQESEGV